MLARKYEQREWLLEAHIQLVQRAGSLSLDEAQQLGMETTVEITACREESRFGGTRSVSRSSVTRHTRGLKELLARLDGLQD